MNGMNELDTRDATRRYWIQTYGCQMNVRDSELLASQLESAGYRPADKFEAADVIVVNTCSVREKAEHKLYSQLGRLKSLARQPRKRLVVAGCVAQQERGRILARAPHVDLVLGTHQVRELDLHLRGVEAGTSRVQTDWKHRAPHARLGTPDPVRRGQPSAYVTIQEGCDNVCTFCIVPFTRGRELSRPVEAVLSEVRAHVRRGAKEIVLLGQNVNSYGWKQPELGGFATLLRHVHAEPGVERIRFTSPHPKDYGDDLVAAYRELPKLCPSAHLPLQAGSDRILAAMRRGYTGTQFLEIVSRLREARPDLHLSTDIIVGFPGETRADFERTLEIVARVRFSQIYAFVYSARPHTPAAELADPIPKATKQAWLQELLALQRQIQSVDHAAWVGAETNVLWTDHRDGRLRGRSPQGRIVHARGPVEAIGEIELVAIERATANALYGTRLAEHVDAAAGG